jgi:hypothetical protein
MLRTWQPALPAGLQFSFSAHNPAEERRVKKLVLHFVHLISCHIVTRQDKKMAFARVPRRSAFTALPVRSAPVSSDNDLIYSIRFLSHGSAIGSDVESANQHSQFQSKRTETSAKGSAGGSKPAVSTTEKIQFCLQDLNSVGIKKVRTKCEHGRRKPHARTAAGHQSANMAASSPRAKTAEVPPSVNTAASSPHARTAAGPPSVSTVAESPGASIAAGAPSANTAAKRTNARTAAGAQSANTVAESPRARTAAVLQFANTAASSPHARAAAVPPSANTAESSMDARTAARLPTPEQKPPRPERLGRTQSQTGGLAPGDRVDTTGCCGVAAEWIKPQ